MIGCSCGTCALCWQGILNGSIDQIEMDERKLLPQLKDDSSPDNVGITEEEFEDFMESLGGETQEVEFDGIFIDFIMNNYDGDGITEKDLKDFEKFMESLGDETQEVDFDGILIDSIMNNYDGIFEQEGSNALQVPEPQANTSMKIVHNTSSNFQKARNKHYEV